MYHFILGVHMLLTALAMAYLGVILVEKASDVTKYLLIATVCNFFVIFGYTLEIMGTDRAYSLTSVKIQFLGLIFLISFLLFFMTKICDVEIPKPMRFVIIGVDVVLLVLAMTAENHSLFFKTIDYTFDGHYPHMIVEEGVAVRFSLYYTIVQGFVFALVAIIKERRNKDRIPTPVIFLPFCFLPAIIALIFFYMLTPENMGFNPVPGSITVGMSYLIFMVYRFRLLDTTQIAKDSIVEDINEGYFVVDVSKKLLFANKLAYNILPGLREPKKRGEVIQEVFRNNRKTLDIKDKQYQVSVSPFYDRKTLKGYSLWLFDKTDELERTRRLIELKNQAEETNQAKTVFLANMSHEIRTPMNTVMGSTEMILRSNPSPEVQSYASDIKKSGSVLLNIISGVLDFSKIESGQVESVEVNYDVGSYLKEVVKQYAPRIQEKGLSFPINVSESIPRGLRGDAIHVRQILTNLLDNSIKYTESGFISLTVDWEETEEKDKIRIIITVEDTGRGIKESAIPKLFDSFQRADLRRNLGIQGTGLGLAISKKLVESMDGEIKVTSIYGSGSKFTFYVMQKVYDPAPIGDFAKIKEQIAVAEGGEDFIAPEARILCVDDNATNRKVLRELFSIYRIQADTAESGEECLKLLRRGNYYHIIFMDQMMPGLDGIETAKEIRTLSGEIRRTPIIALTANAVVGARERFLENGFQDYLTKPVDLENLERVLLDYLPEKVICYVENRQNPGEYGRAIVLPGADTKAGLARYHGDRSRYLHALKYIYDDGEKQLNKMRRYVGQMDTGKYELEVHALKGLTLGIGAYELSEKCKSQEAAAKEGRTEEIKEKGPEMLRDYEMLLANIRFVLVENGLSVAPKQVPVTKEEMPEEELQKQLAVLKEALSMLDEKKAEDLVTGLLSTKMDMSKRNLLLTAKEQILNFDYEDASSTIDSLIIR